MAVKSKLAKPGERLQSLLDIGQALLHDGNILVWASDGQWCQIGVNYGPTDNDFLKAEAYLEDHPTPDTW